MSNARTYATIKREKRSRQRQTDRTAAPSGTQGIPEVKPGPKDHTTRRPQSGEHRKTSPPTIQGQSGGSKERRTPPSNYKTNEA